MPYPIKPATFGPTFCKWWRTLQPDLRGKSGADRPTDIHPDLWRRLRVFQENGFFLIMIGLAWWGMTQKDEASLKLWGELVDDVMWVLKQWCPSTTQSKRSRGDSTVEPRKRRRRAN